MSATVVFAAETGLDAFVACSSRSAVSYPSLAFYPLRITLFSSHCRPCRLQRVFSSSQGLCNAVAYGLTSDGIKDAVQDDLAAWFPGCCGHLGATRRGRGGGSVLEHSAAEGGAAGSKRASGAIGAGGSSGTAGGMPPEEDTLAAAHSVAPPRPATAGDAEASWRRLNQDSTSVTVDDRALQPPRSPPPAGSVTVLPNPLAAATAAAGGPAPAGVSREERVRALQQGPASAAAPESR